MFGVLPVLKPARRTSRDVCNRIERVVRPDKVGHTGTLDPMATGVLLLAIGSASRLVEFSLGHSKAYEADFLLGVSSDTLDTDGTLQELPGAPRVQQEAIAREAAKWIGTVAQIPPKFSAINVGGRRAYDLARKGRDFELAAREISIYAIEILACEYPLVTMRIECGSGTYIRSLGSDIARGLGTDAVMSRLVRTRVGPFELADCVALDAIVSRDDVLAGLRPPHDLIANLPWITLDHEQTVRIRHGIPLMLDGQLAEKIAAVDKQNNLVAVLARTPEMSNYRSVRVFHEASETIQPNTINTPHSPES